MSCRMRGVALLPTHLARRTALLNALAGQIKWSKKASLTGTLSGSPSG